MLRFKNNIWVSILLIAILAGSIFWLGSVVSQSDNAIPADGKVFCPVCQEKGLKSCVYEGSCMSTLVYNPTWYDEEGNKQYINTNTTTCYFSCNQGHEWCKMYCMGETTIRIIKDTEDEPETHAPFDTKDNLSLYGNDELTWEGDIVNYEPATTIIFGDNVGKISWDNGVMVFEGDAEESAEIFFEFLKPMIDGYIEEELSKISSESKDIVNNILIWDAEEGKWCWKTIDKWKYIGEEPEYLYLDNTIEDLPQNALKIIWSYYEGDVGYGTMDIRISELKANEIDDTKLRIEEIIGDEYIESIVVNPYLIDIGILIHEERAIEKLKEIKKKLMEIGFEYGSKYESAKSEEEDELMTEEPEMIIFEFTSGDEFAKTFFPQTFLRINNTDLSNCLIDNRLRLNLNGEIYWIRLEKDGDMPYIPELRVDKLIIGD